MTFETGVTYPVTEELKQAWRGFEGRKWREDVNVREFIQSNYTMYDGDESFLAPPTEATNKLWGRLQELQKEERAKGGVLECETEVVSSLTSYGPGYIDESMKELEQVVGLQTDKPLKRAFMPYGGIKMADQAAATYGYEINSDPRKIFTDYHKTHNQAVFDAYTPEMKRARHSHVITGLPDTYGRGRIVGDYRRVALYGLDYLIFVKEKDLFYCGGRNMSDEHIRLREEIAEQIRALKGMKKMAEIYGFDISQPAKNAREAVQWLYFGYLAAIKTQNGAAMSVGRISTFLDIYIQRDLDEGTLTESEAQELIDHLVLKFRMVKFARIPSYITSCSRAIPSGSPSKWRASAWTADTWSPRTTTASSIPSRTWDLLPSRTSRCSGRPDCPRPSRNTRPKFPSIPAPSSTKTTASCVLSGAMTTAFAAAFPRLRRARRSSSSAREPTSRSA